MLIEAALTTVIVGVAVVAMLSVIGQATRTNSDNRDLTKAIFLAQEIREMMASLPATNGPGTFGPGPGETLANYGDQDDFNGQSLSPPINAQRQRLTGGDWPQWRQEITVANVDPNNLSGHQTIYPGSTDMMRVTVTVKKNGRMMYQMSWLIAGNL